MRLHLLLSLSLMFFFTGCVLVQPNYMTSNDKRLVYQSVQNEIEEYKVQADIYYHTGYYADAANAYEMVNFYEDAIVIPLEKIRATRLKAKKNAKSHYYRALKYLKNNKKRALIELNKTLRNNPNFKDTKIRFETLKKDIKIQAMLNKMEESLKHELNKDLNQANTLKRIEKATNKLSTYDDSNSLVIEAKNTLKKQRELLLSNAITLYNQGNLDSAEKKFQLIQSVYPKDTVCRKYLSNIFAKKDLKITLQKAKKALKANDLPSVISLCEKAMEYAPYNSEARTLSQTAKKEYEKQIPKLIDEGKTFYNNQDFVNAKKRFQSVLLWDADNGTCLAYIKKIDQQLKTIESLR
ncbi:MAG: hypothetical protein ACNI3C_00305 [Candidatus Marinarcus sp.]|uniref:hypothetical protein n=1 Tax=Candidatus Marinarcus sp. TaxID=3100987 RepID=UPI003AFFE498